MSNNKEPKPMDMVSLQDLFSQVLDSEKAKEAQDIVQRQIKLIQNS